MKGAIFLICFVGLLAREAQGADLGTITRQYREFFLGSAPPSSSSEAPPDSKNAMAASKSLAADGHWSDLDYDSTVRSEWPPSEHAQRIVSMTMLAEKNGAPAEYKKMLLPAIHRAFAFWIAHDFKCKNWWQNQIGVPQQLGCAGILLGNDLTPDERQYLTHTLLPRAKISMTGQNRVWLAGNTILLGLLTDNSATVLRAADAIWSEIVISEKEGIQADYSFQQHGPQQQFGNYGGAFAVESCKWGQILRGTPQAMPEEKLAIYRDFLLNGQNWITYRGSMDISSCGRQLFVDSPRSKANTITQVMRAAAEFDPAHAADYLAFVQRNTREGKNDLLGNRCYWRSDYAVNRGEDLFASVKMHSKRTIGTESLNSENLRGYYLSDGATYFYQRGDEYDGIFPVWDWNKLPGVTCALSEKPPAPPTGANLKTDRMFVGGATAGAFGCEAMDYARDGVMAKKSWFFAGEEAVCLGAGIRCENEKQIATTINQCLLRGPVTVHAAGQEKTITGNDQTLPATQWVEQDGLRYTFATPVLVQASAGPRTGNWHTVYSNPGTPKADVTKDIFTLSINHGIKPDGATYAYAVGLAGKTSAEKGVMNSETIQAVQWDDDHLAAVFWKPGQLPQGVSVDQPCALLLDMKSHHATVSDPTHILKSITLTANGRQKQIDLPTGMQAGKSVDVSLN